jgi:glycerol uptake facilitator protein
MTAVVYNAPFQPAVQDALDQSCEQGACPTARTRNADAPHDRGPAGLSGLGIIALSFGLVVALVIYTLGTTSGAHINPAVTVALTVTGRFRWVDAATYVAAQVLGAVLGAFLVVGVTGTKTATAAGVGLTSTAQDVSAGQAVLAEGLGTFLLLFTVMAVAVDRRAPVGWAGGRLS